jgi:hypothetical protein
MSFSGNLLSINKWQVIINRIQKATVNTAAFPKNNI